MCRRDQVLCIGLFAFGLGLLVAGWIESSFWRWVWGVGLVIAGVLALQKK